MEIGEPEEQGFASAIGGVLPLDAVVGHEFPAPFAYETICSKLEI